MARRPLERERVYLDGGRRTTQLMRDSLGGTPVQTPPTPHSRKHKRSALVKIAFGFLCAAILSLMVRNGLFWTGLAAALAVAFGVAEIVLQLRRRGASA